MKNLNFKTNYVFPDVARYLGYLIALIGFVATFTNGVQVIFICLIGLGVGFTRNGVFIDVDGRRFKEYTSVFWIKFGTWKSLEDYPYLTVLTITEKQTSFSNSNVANTNRNLVYRITLLNHNHYVKILLKKHTVEEAAHQEAQSIADLIDLEKTIYSPG